MFEPVYRFCPACGAALEPRAIRTNEPTRLVCTNGDCRHVFYLDPKLAVGTIIEMDGGIVLVRRAIDPGYGRWVFPGGYVDRGEELQIAAAREAKEETGLDVSIDRLVNIYSYTGTVAVIVVYGAAVTGGAFAADDENSEIRIFRPAEIPWDELAFQSTVEALREYFEKRGDRPTGR